MICPHPYPPPPDEVLRVLPSMTEVGISLCGKTAQAFLLPWDHFAAAFGSQNHPTFVFQVRNEVQQCLMFCLVLDCVIWKVEGVFSLSTLPLHEDSPAEPSVPGPGVSQWKKDQSLQLGEDGEFS